MSLSPLPIVDTRPYFRPVSSALLGVLRGLGPDHWTLGTVAGSWTVRDVLSHLVDVSFRRVSFHRDRLVPPPPPFPIEGERDFVRFINGLNHEWVAATKRCSPQVLTELFELASRDLADFLEALPLDAPALFGVSWAGEFSSEGWFDLGREFTELWHHQQQIRLAVGAPPLDDPRFLRAVLDVSMRVLPHAYRDVDAQQETTLVVQVDGPSGGLWTLKRESDAWRLWSGAPERADVRLRLSDESAWRLFYNALPSGGASSAVAVEGARDLTAAFFNARSIVI